ncbi:MAG: amidase [Janthinobacterium lividum]
MSDLPPASRYHPDALPPLATLAAALAAGILSSRALTERALERIEDTRPALAHVFTHVDAAGARAAADAADALRRAGTQLSPLAGLPVSIKDLFDIAGQVTRAASVALAGVPRAVSDADAVGRLRHAGAVLMGRTNMSEFACSATGVNPHFGTPVAPWRSDEARIPGGSSSGAAASVAHGMAALGLGTDTGGSTRIPAAFCALTGFKPTAARISQRGVVPLSASLDSVGPIAHSVACCAIADRILAGLPPSVPRARALAGTRIGILANYVSDDLDAPIAAAFDHALRALEAAGATLEEVRIPALDALSSINRVGFVPMEAYAWHRQLIAEHGRTYDPQVLKRILQGRDASAADYIELLAKRQETIAAAGATLAQFDALAFVTVPMVPPRIAELADEARLARTHGRLVRNSSWVNFIDGCAISLPCHHPDEAPCGLTLSSAGGRDDALLAVALSAEQALAASF